jgi:hypothetical protein
LVGLLADWESGLFSPDWICLVLHSVYYLYCYQTWQTAKHTIQYTAKQELRFKVKNNVTKSWAIQAA